MAEVKKKNQLHQLLAVEPDLRVKAQKIMEETLNTFVKKSEHFDGMIKAYEPFEVAEGEDESQRVPSDIKEVVTTVKEKLDYTAKSIAKALDAVIQKDETNGTGRARAELAVGEKKFGEFGATTLLSIEQFLIKIRAVYKMIPTLDPVRAWNKDEGSGRAIYVTGTEVRYRTEKQKKVVTLAPPTKEHPAQTQLVDSDHQVGQYNTIYKSGKITPKDKSDLLTRIDRLIVAVKKTRAEANQAEVVKTRIAKELFRYIGGMEYVGLDEDEIVI